MRIASEQKGKFTSIFPDRSVIESMGIVIILYFVFISPSN